MGTIYVTRDTMAYPMSKDRRWSKGIELQKGSRFETVYYGHLPAHVTDGVDADILEEVKDGRYLIIYYKRQYLLVSKNEVDQVKW